MTGRGAEQPVGVDSQVRARVEESPFESLTRELFARDWDMSLDRKNEAFITAFENENEKWELQVNFDDEADYLVSSRSRWSIDKEEIGVVSQALNRMNSELMIDTFGSEIGVNEDLFCFEVKTRSELPERMLSNRFSTPSRRTPDSTVAGRTQCAKPAATWKGFAKSRSWRINSRLQVSRIASWKID